MSEINKGNRDVSLLEDYIYNNGNIKLTADSFPNEKEFIISKIMLSIIKGSINPEFESLISFLPLKLQEVVYLRWNSIVKIYNNNLEEAESSLLEALQLAKSTRQEKWIRRDILLDLNNVSVLKQNRQGVFLSEKPHQKELRSMEKWHYRPQIDWNLENASFGVLKENFNIHTDSPYTVRFGGNFSSTMEQVSRSLTAAITYGSLTFIYIIRERLGYILYNYGKIYDDSKLLFHSLKLFIIEDNVKTVKKILDSEWVNLEKEFIDSPSALINEPFLKDNRPQNDVMKCIIIEKLGPYFYDEELNEIDNFLENCLDKPFSMNQSMDIRRSAIRAYKDLINRIEDNERILEKLYELFANDNHLVKDEIFKLLPKINWNKVNESLSKQFILTIIEEKDEALNQRNTYIILYYIKKAHPEIIKEIETFMELQWRKTRSLDINYYFSLLENTSPMVNEFVDDILQRIKQGNERMTKGSVIGFGGNSLYHLLANHYINNPSMLGKEVIDVYKEVLINPYQLDIEKRECIESIMRIKDIDNKSDLLIKNQFHDFFQNEFEKIMVSRSDSFFEKFSAERLELKIYELLISLGANFISKDKILAKCIEYSTHTFIDVREGTLMLVEAILKEYPKDNINEIRQFLYSRTYDKYHKVRGNAIFILSQMNNVNQEWENIIVNRMFELIEDSNSYVRSSVIAAVSKLIKDNKQNEKYKDMLAILKRDRHYKLRDLAIKGDIN